MATQLNPIVMNGQQPTNSLGQPLDQATIQQYTNNANAGQFDWSGLGYNSWDPKGDAIVKAYMANFGRLPTQQEFDMAAPQFQGPNGNAYVASLAQQQQAQQNAPQQEQQALQQQMPIINDLVNSQMQSQIKNLTDPTSDAYKSFAGNMNNLGITPSSGAFQAGLGNAIGQADANFISDAMGKIGLPIASTYSQGATTPFTTAMGQPGQLQSQGYDWQQFLAQSQLAKQLAEEGNPSGAQNAFGMATGGAGALGSLAQGGSALKSSGATWICTAMCEVGTMNVFEVQKLHYHLFKAIHKRPFKFLGYWIFGKFLVLLANRVNTNWNAWKSDFYYNVINEPDPVKAVDIYAEAFWRLFANVRERLHEKAQVA